MEYKSCRPRGTAPTRARFEAVAFHTFKLVETIERTFSLMTLSCMAQSGFLSTCLQVGSFLLSVNCNDTNLLTWHDWYDSWTTLWTPLPCTAGTEHGECLRLASSPARP